MHTGGRGKTIQYELLYDGNNVEHQRQLMGLIDIEALKQHYDAEKLGCNDEKTDPRLGQVGPKLAGCLDNETVLKANADNSHNDIDVDLTENTYIGGNGSDASYSQSPSLVASAK